MREVEIKILEVNVSSLVAKLKKLGAKKVFEGEMIGYAYDFPDGRLKKNGSFLRLRSKGDHFELTFKKSIQSKKAKIAEEYQVSLKEGKAAQKIVQSLGLKQIRKGTKKRISYSLGKINFDIDKYDENPALFEIEAPDVKTLHHWVKKIGFSLTDMKLWNGKQVFKYYGKKQD